MQKTGTLQEQNKSKFYDALLSEGMNFVDFYKNQIQYFKQVTAAFIEDLEDDDIDKLFQELPSGQYTKTTVWLACIWHK